MLVKVRENIFVGDENVKADDLRKNGITVIEVVTDEKISFEHADCQVFAVDLHTDQINKPHVKDIACHIPKFMVQNGEIVAIISKNGLIRAPFVAARAICELENKTIYDILMEFPKLIKGFDIGKAYL